MHYPALKYNITNSGIIDHNIYRICMLRTFLLILLAPEAQPKEEKPSPG